jgi:sulfate transport system permease protein
MTGLESTFDDASASGRRAPNWGKWSLRSAAVIYLGVMVALPLAAIVQNGFKDGIGVFWSDVTGAVALSALKLTLGAALLVTLINAVMGTLTSFVLVRYDFPGKTLLNGLVDIPFAVPTLVTGVMLVALYGPQGLVGRWFIDTRFQVIFARPGIILALLVITYPFVIRAVQPVLLEMEREQEEASYTLGASKRTTFRKIVLPTILPAIATGSLLTFARALGEFGSIVVVAGNIPQRTLTAPVFIYGQIESDNQRSASSMSFLLVAISFTLILAVEWLQARRGPKNVAG